ncbi:MAG: acyl-coenzyme A synthetase/AMP-(fatty) acid ligase/thioesterase domain-containing protein [Verrucomicrobiales bacterium]|jgi:acyl-coenzyme A synthetase/AMP-(fatty) acid ligase/thioesterase domain-containing protein/acyl carrier protein
MELPNPNEILGADRLPQSIGAHLQKTSRAFGARLSVVDSTNRWDSNELHRRSAQLSAHLACCSSNSKISLLFLKDGSDATSGIIAGILSGFCSIVVTSPFQLKSLQKRFPDAVVTFRGLVSPLPEGKSRNSTVDLDALSTSATSKSPRFKPTLDTPVQAVLTSGSTGEPKAVAHSHGAILNQGRNYTRYAKLTSDDRIAVIAPLASITGQSSLFGALLNGAAACFYDIENYGIDSFAEWLKLEKITVLHATPTIFRALANIVAEAGSIFSSLRLVRIGGEPITKMDLAAIRSITPRDCAIYMGYGCSEMGTITRLVTDHESSKDLSFDKGAPVGAPSDNIDVAICDSAGFALPDGELGEVVVTSEFLSIGYLEDPEATQRAYSKSGAGSARSYRTGDMGIMQSGQLFLRGRVDRQVKVRGHRLELDAVEAQLSAIPEFGSVAVESIQVRFNGNPPVTQLYAFLSSQDLGIADTRTLRQLAAAKLPTFMVPAKFIVIPTLPKTKTGKVDRAALRQLAAAHSERTDSPDDAPTSDLEAWLLERWVTLLHNKRIDIHDDFFEIGGDSMAAVRLFHEIGERTGIVLPVSALLEVPTIAELAQRIETSDNESGSSLIITLRDRGSQSPLFLIHDIGGNVVNYRRLTQELSDDQPVYGIRSPGLDVNPDTATTLPHSVEELATLYINEITACIGDRPIALAGLSFGGKVAFEMAQQLHRAERQVTFLGLLDTRLEMRDFRPDAASRKVTSAIRSLTYQCRRAFFHLHRIASGKTDDDYLQERIRKRRKKQRAATGNSNSVRPADSRSQLSPEQKAAAWHRKLGTLWTPQPSAIPIHYFTAMDPSLRGPFDNMANWKSLSQRGLQIDPVPGNHISILEDPNAAILAKALTHRMLTDSAHHSPETVK